ncbi:uncharacterized protein B0H18DRAFT_960722 [Fomitopsis serialis]|uniref:uncharacterized protein n=1 Tax=Fomitopsis serialis TaxID=139415 RepID=UPI0020077142|nr:uncharacterized protein B0H18DRAFT_960722 [Neoantrodia serialis]KAH9912889.1 hypothetical protein B0H18DRAFT_960722 [Neoantrodia serialis]
MLPFLLTTPRSDLRALRADFDSAHYALRGFLMTQRSVGGATLVQTSDSRRALLRYRYVTEDVREPSVATTREFEGDMKAPPNKHGAAAPAFSLDLRMARQTNQRNRAWRDAGKPVHASPPGDPLGRHREAHGWSSELHDPSGRVLLRWASARMGGL